MLELPYGLADFRRIREEGLVYVDRTGYIRTLERLGSNLVFLRPRRFGKSLWVQTLATYYDLRLADEFETIFGDLEIGREPTPHRNRYFVLQWNFSLVKPASTVPEIEESLREHIAEQAKMFNVLYRDHLEEVVDPGGSPVSILDSVLQAVRRTPSKLYLLIDEYDNFVNEVMVSNIETYRALFAESGPFKVLFKSIKNALEGKGLERVFTTGVTPVALTDLTSGFNNAKNVTLHKDLAGLCGFYSGEVRDLLDLVAAEAGLDEEKADEAADVMRTWYNGYRFHAREAPLVYNPTNVLYFLQGLQDDGEVSLDLHDENLRTDSGKLAFIARSAEGTGIVEELSEGSGEVEIYKLDKSFSVETLVQRLETNREAVLSFLYYMGLLSFSESPIRLRIPNLVVRQLFLERLLEIHLSFGGVSAAHQLAVRFFHDGDLQPLLIFFEERVFPTLSNRDQGTPPRKEGQSGSGVNEMTIKAFFLSILFEDTRYVVTSEPELERSYADLCLLRRPGPDRGGLLDFLFEFKYVRRMELGKKGEDLKTMDDAALHELTPVKKAFKEAREQAQRYRERLRKRQADLNLRSYAVVAVGLDRLLGEEVRD